MYFSFTLLNLNFVLFRFDCGMFVLKNADCLGQDLDPAAGHYYAQKDMPNVRRVALLELIRLKIISGTATATLPASIDPKGDGDTKVETKESDSQPSTIEIGAPSSESPSKRRKPNGAQLESEGDTTATLPPSIDPNLCDKGSGESKADTDNGQPSSKDANNDEKTEEAVVTVAPKEDDEEETVAEQMLVDDENSTIENGAPSSENSHSESDSDPDDIRPLSKRPKPNDDKKDAEDTEDEVKPEDEDDDNEDDNKDDDEDAGEADTVRDMENEDEKTDRIGWKLEWLDFILKIENIEPITLGDLLSLLYKPTRDAISCMVDICCRDWVQPLNSNSFFIADGEDITGASINKFIECKDEGNPVSNAVYIGE